MFPPAGQGLTVAPKTFENFCSRELERLFVETILFSL